MLYEGSPIHEPITEPLYYEAEYPEGGTDRMWFWPDDKEERERIARDDNTLHISNVRFGPPPHSESSYYHLESPQTFIMEALAVVPVFSDPPDSWLLGALFNARSCAVYKFTLGNKVYSEGPLAHIMSLDFDPKQPVDLSKTWPVTAKNRNGGKDLPLHIPSEQGFGLKIMFNWRGDPMKMPFRLRAYLIGTRYRPC